MKILRIHVPLALCLLLMLAVGLFYGQLYPYHLHYYEQMQMFQFSWAYFWETVLLPGGMADWMGRLLTQFFCITWAGALIMALLYGGVYFTAWRAVARGLNGKNSLLWSIMMLLPIRFMWEYGCYEDAMPATWIAMIMSLASVWALRPIGHDFIRRMLSLALTIMLYALVGPIAFLFTVLMILNELRKRDTLKWIWCIALILIALILPPLAHKLCNWPLASFWQGIHYFRFANVHLPYIWEAMGVIVLIAIAVPILQHFIKVIDGINVHVLGFGTLALMVLVTWLGVKREYRPNTEVVMMYDDMVLNERWTDILDEAHQRTPKYPACLQCINLAMAMTGQMGDLLFHCPQSSADCLLPQFQINFPRPLTAGQIYLNLGWTNTAQRMIYEAQESIPDYEKSARCYKLLTMTHVIRGEKELARKYLYKLQNTLFYSDWANETLKLLDDPDPKAIAQHSFYGPLMNGAVRDDYFFSPDMLAMLGNYCTTTPHNRVATQYLLGLALVERDLDAFVGCFNFQQYLSGEQRIPEFWQQALALYWFKQHQTLEGIPYNIDQRVLDGLAQLEQARAEHMPMEQIQQHFLFTYWYYYYNKPEEEQKADKQ